MIFLFNLVNEAIKEGKWYEKIYFIFYFYILIPTNICFLVYCIFAENIFTKIFGIIGICIYSFIIGILTAFDLED